MMLVVVMVVAMVMMLHTESNTMTMVDSMNSNNMELCQIKMMSLMSKVGLLMVEEHSRSMHRMETLT